MKELEYPFDSEYILRKKKSLKRQLSCESVSRIRKKIAILGGSTTQNIKEMLELFLLNNGIEPEFYESEYAQYWQDVMFDESALREFHPDVIYIHTTTRNLNEYPGLEDTTEDIENKISEIFKHFLNMWEKIATVYQCPVIQNNFEMPYYRLLGNRDCYDPHGRVDFINRLNSNFYGYAQTHKNFFINDINYLSACYGLQIWADPFYWHMYKYALAVPAIPELSFNVANIIKSIYGKNKKAFVLDLDNTLWGGVVGEDGADNIEIGQETSVGQIYREFQQYIKEYRSLGVILNINSKNDYDNAISGLMRPDSILKPDDFIVIKANWNAKDRNIIEIAEELNIGVDSIVFVDDNPAERQIVSSQLQDVAVPEIGGSESYIKILDRSGYFEVTNYSEDDFKRNEMYKANAERIKLKATFADYKEFLLSLDMNAEICPFSHLYIARIAQLTNKSNQFNLTTKRYTLSQIEEASNDEKYITLYGRLTDKFGDNGIVSVMIGRKVENELEIELFLMSCRVLKRDMEKAMLDKIVLEGKKQGIQTIIGYYFPTSKNRMVRNLYFDLGFKKCSEDADGNTIWKLDISGNYRNQNQVIKVEDN